MWDAYKHGFWRELILLKKKTLDTYVYRISSYVQQVDILITKNQVLRILYSSSIKTCMIIINFIVYNDTVLQCYTQTYLI